MKESDAHEKINIEPTTLAAKSTQVHDSLLNDASDKSTQETTTNTNESKVLESLQLLTTFGYLAFLTMGISIEVLKYLILDINILPYLNLTDILLSPLDVVRQDWIIVVIPFMILLILDVLRSWGLSKKEVTEEYTGRKKAWVNWCAGITFNWFLIGLSYTGFVLGVGGQGAYHDASKLQKKLQAGNLEPSHQLTFTDKETMAVTIVGQTSDFIFYVQKDERQISISPMLNNIKRMVPISAEEKKAAPKSTN